MLFGWPSLWYGVGSTAVRLYGDVVVVTACCVAGASSAVVVVCGRTTVWDCWLVSMGVAVVVTFTSGTLAVGKLIAAVVTDVFSAEFVTLLVVAVAPTLLCV